MDIGYIQSRINRLGDNWDILVLKGFDTEIIKKVGADYILLDKHIYEDSKIDLKKIDSQKLLMSIITLGSGQKAVISIESWLNLASNMRNLGVIGRRFCILENNLLKRIENPTTEDIPDYESADFQSADYKDNLSCYYYSTCSHEDGKQYVEYFDSLLDSQEGIREELLIRPMDIQLEPADGETVANLPKLSLEDESIYRELENIYATGNISSLTFVVDKTEFIANKPVFEVFAKAVDVVGKELHLLCCDESESIIVRPELKEILKRVWGYDSFREINVYRNLYAGKDTMMVSQGEIIENVVRQAEAAQDNPRGMSNILLTAPTGSGKSILFQVPAIYLAEQHDLVTIVISPLVALMNDQVENLESKYEAVATLNSAKSAQQKEQILQNVQNGKVNILYLSPELLLSYSINMFIGTRKIGLLVIDEAHTVTTWGRDFRVDYWFLGDYLRSCQRHLKYKFPIFAVTATAVWDPSKKNDMVFETIRSLNMDPCIKYIGVVKRSNIVFDINTPTINANYQDAKMRLTQEIVHDSIDKRRKTIVYFPYRSSIWQFVKREDDDGYKLKIAQYHAALEPYQKVANANSFRSGEKPVICATKAYGMGIDVPDIKLVYHFSPTGNLSDYVQEIGRLARDPEITGIAKIDFTEKDFRFTRTLHGLSAIRHYQLRAVLKKLMELYHQKGEHRNMLITANDFEYIFPGKNVDYDQKLKSCLLLISNDMLNKYHFHSLIVRPKSLFTDMYLKIKEAQFDQFRTSYGKYIKQTDERNCVVVMNCEKLWMEKYVKVSFQSFKHDIYEGTVFTGFEVTPIYNLCISLNSENVVLAKRALESFFAQAEKILDMMAQTRQRMTVKEMKESLPATYNTEDAKESFVEAFKSLYVSFKDDDDESNEVYCNLYHINAAQDEAIQLMKQGYEAVKMLFMHTFENCIKDNESRFYCQEDNPVISLASLMNVLNIATYMKSGGSNPAIFVRINNPSKLDDIVRKGFYENNILTNIYDRYSYSERVFTYFFTTEMSDEMRWNFIEDYFLGASEEYLLSYTNHTIA